jgi:aldehyde dehydrogenase (NAD(P)+)
MSILIHPKTRKEPVQEAAFQEALDNLRYGSIGINHWAALAYALCCTTWGAHPGHTMEDIQSGRDVVHNTLMFDRPQKSVIFGPLSSVPKPPWFVTHKNTNKIGPRVAKLELKPSLFRIPAIALYAMLG